MTRYQSDDEGRGWVRRVAILIVVLAATLVSTSAASAATPKWSWTPAQAQQQAQAASEQLQPPSGDGVWFFRAPTDISGCRGVGKASQGGFGSFRCRAKVQTMNKNPFETATKTLWFKVRRQGAGTGLREPHRSRLDSSSERSEAGCSSTSATVGA